MVEQSKSSNPVTGVPFVAFAPRSIVQHQIADWDIIRADNVKGVRHESFDYEFKASPGHLLIASERAERYDGETLVDGLPRSHVRAWNQRLTFVPAGTRFYGWQKPRALSRVTFLIEICGRLHSSSRRRWRIQLKTKAPMSRRSVSHWHTSSCA